MQNKEKQIQTIKNIILRGIVRYSDIVPRLKHAEIPVDKADHVADLVINYKYGINRNITDKLNKGVLHFFDKIISFLFAIVGAILFGEFIAIKEFAGSLLEDKLKGFGDHLLYWIGLKSISLTGPEMMSAFTKVVASTFNILKGMAIGLIVGYIFWIALSRLTRFLYKRNKLKKDINRLLKSFSYLYKTNISNE